MILCNITLNDGPNPLRRGAPKAKRPGPPSRAKAAGRFQDTENRREIQWGLNLPRPPGAGKLAARESLMPKQEKYNLHSGKEDRVFDPKEEQEKNTIMPMMRGEGDKDTSYSMRVFHPDQGSITRDYQSVESRERGRAHYKRAGIRTRRI